MGDYADFRVCPAAEDGKPAAALKDGKAPAPAKPAKPAAGKRLEKPQAPVVPERTPPVDRPPIRYSRPAALAPAALEPEKR